MRLIDITVIIRQTSIAGLQSLRAVLDLLPGTTIHLLLELGELAGNVGGVAVQNWSVASRDLARVVHDDD